MSKTELQCQESFLANGPYYQVATSHTVTESLFRTPEMVRTVISLSGYYAKKMNVRVLGYEAMLTHMHNIYAATREQALAHTNAVLEHYLRCDFTTGMKVRLRDLEPKAFEINDLRQFRNEMAYVVRNRFVVDPDANLFGDGRGTGYLYFNEILSLLPPSKPLSNYGVVAKRKLLHMRNGEDLPGLTVVDGMIDPRSFVDYKLVESMFPNARKYVMWVMKNLEAQVELTLSRGESPMLNDDEMMNLIFKKCRERFGKSTPSQLPLEQRRVLAVEVRREYFATNAQLCRCLSLTPDIVNSLFPMSAKQPRP